MSTETPENELPQDDLDQSRTGEQSEESDTEVDPLTAMQDERDQYRDQFLRTAAEMENFRKRVNRERVEERKYASIGLIGDLLPAIDNLQRGLDAAADDDSAGNVLQGVQMVLKQFEEILTRHGVEPITAQGELFDPNLHEALQQRPTNEVPPMTVIDVLERGFKLGDRVIRASKVIVSSEVEDGE